MPRIHVAAAVIRSPEGQVLIARRPADKHQGGLWEFPGGKVEPGEAVREALGRELREELGIQVTEACPLIRIRHDYPDKSVLLDVWEVTAFEGTAHGAEGQPLAWVAPDALPGYAFPAANRPIVSAARLPDRYWITPDDADPARLLEGLARALDGGARLVQLRAPRLGEGDYRAVATQALARCAGRAEVLLKGPLAWAGDFPAAGWHLTAQQLRALTPGSRPLPAGRWLAASCHDAAELALARACDVDFVTLSPIRATLSHPGSPALGWSAAEALLETFDRPAFLLGGLTAGDLAEARARGGQGIAAIRGLWPA